MSKLTQEAEQAIQTMVADTMAENGYSDLTDPISSAKNSFSIAPAVHQILLDEITKDENGFLSQINNEMVEDIKGEKLFLGTDGKVIAATNDANREPVNPYQLSAENYECTLTDFDVVISNTLLNNWARHKDFQKRLGDHMLKEFLNDRLRIGWNGVSRAAKSDREANPLGQDVNRGWLQYLRDVAPEQVMNEAAEGAGAIEIGENGHFKTLDLLVQSAKVDLIPTHLRQEGNLVAFLGEGMMSDRQLSLGNQNLPSEILAAAELDKIGRVGGLPAMEVSYFPENTILITSLDNISRYEQDGSRRRKIDLYDPARRGMVNWEEYNEAYVIEKVGKAALLENINMA